MENKIVFIIELLIILGLFSFYIIKEVVPDYKKSLGSSDKFINVELFDKMYEFNIDNNVNFSIIIDKNNSICHMFFFDRNSTCLANRNIENNTIEVGLNEIYTILINSGYLSDTSIIKIIRYNTDDKFIYDSILGLNSKYDLDGSINIVDSSIKKKVSDLELSVIDDEKSLLKELDLYSKEFIRMKKNTVLTKKESINIKELSDNVYSKLSNYINMNSISDLEINDTTLIINMIPADVLFKYYPSINSWYYVKEKKVFAYIEFVIDDNNVKGYCYNGSIDAAKEGVCE